MLVGCTAAPSRFDHLGMITTLPRSGIGDDRGIEISDVGETVTISRTIPALFQPGDCTVASGDIVERG